MAESTKPTHVTLAVVFQVRVGKLQVLLWERAKEPFARRLVPPGRLSRARRDARGLDPQAPGRARSTSGSSRTSSSSRPAASPTATRASGSSRPPTSGSCRSGSIPRCPRTRTGTRSTDCRSSRSTTARSRSPAASGCGRSSRTRTSASRSRRRRSRMRELRDVYAAALGHDLSATNLQRVLVRRGCSRRPASAASSGRAGRPSGRALPVQHAGARGDRSVRGAAPARASGGRRRASPGSRAA